MAITSNFHRDYGAPITSANGLLRASESSQYGELSGIHRASLSGGFWYSFVAPDILYRHLAIQMVSDVIVERFRIPKFQRNTGREISDHFVPSRGLRAHFFDRRDISDPSIHSSIDKMFRQLLLLFVLLSSSSALKGSRTRSRQLQDGPLDKVPEPKAPPEVTEPPIALPGKDDKIPLPPPPKAACKKKKKELKDPAAKGLPSPPPPAPKEGGEFQTAGSEENPEPPAHPVPPTPPEEPAEVIDPASLSWCVDVRVNKMGNCEDLRSGVLPRKTERVSGRLSMEISSDKEDAASELGRKLQEETSFVAVGCGVRRLEDIIVAQQGDIVEVEMQGVNIGNMVLSDDDCTKANGPASANCAIITSDVTIYYSGEDSSEQKEALFNSLTETLQSQIKSGSFNDIGAVHYAEASMNEDEINSNKTTASDATPGIMGGVIAAVAVVILAGVAFFIYKKRSQGDGCGSSAVLPANVDERGVVQVLSDDAVDAPAQGQGRAHVIAF